MEVKLLRSPFMSVSRPSSASLRQGCISPRHTWFRLPSSRLAIRLFSSFSRHGWVGRCKRPDEHPFFPNDLPEPILPPLEYPKVQHPAANSININVQVWNMFFKNLLPRLVKEGDDGNHGPAVTRDTICLQALSKRIHYGKSVAEAKFRAPPDVYESAIKNTSKNHDT